MLKKGDTIKCSCKEEMIDVSCELEEEGYGTDFLYEKDGKEGLWVVISKGVRKKND